VPIVDPSGAGPRMWIVPVPEPKIVKSRMHHDVLGDTAALLAAGATLVRLGDADTEPDGAIEWDVLADPEGNEFCVFTPCARPHMSRNADRGGPPKRTAPAGDGLERPRCRAPP
jgi:hypothetical protein